MRELGLALGRWHPELEVWYVLNPRLPAPAELVARLAALGAVVTSNDSGLPDDGLYHLPSAFEPSSVDDLWPPAVRHLPLVVTLHDLIPAVFPDEQMPDPAVRRAYWARVELIRQADRVLNVSRATANDAVELLGLAPERLSVTGGGVSDEFRPPESADAARAELRRLRPAVDSEYVLYTGGMDYRKNVGGLLQAYAALPADLRARYKLVLVGRLGPDDPRGPFAAQAASLGVGGRVVFTGFVSDEELVLLYQAASLFVFPSLYEGFGLPVVEALACGAPALSGGNSSLVELVDVEDAFFDAADPGEIRAALERALVDDDLRDRLRRPEIRERFSWRRIAELTADAYRELVPRPRPARLRPRILCVAPLTGDEGERTRRTLEALAAHCEVDLLLEEPGAGNGLPDGVERVSLDGLERVENFRGGYDETIYWLGSSAGYALPLHLLRQRPGLVVAYDVRLAGVYDWTTANRPELEPRRFLDVVRAAYPGHRAAPSTVRDHERAGIFLAGEAIRSSRKFFVHDPGDLLLARLEAAPGDEAKVEALAPDRQSAEAVAERLYSEITNRGVSRDKWLRSGG